MRRIFIKKLIIFKKTSLNILPKTFDLLIILVDPVVALSLRVTEVREHNVAF